MTAASKTWTDVEGAHVKRDRALRAKFDHGREGEKSSTIARI